MVTVPPSISKILKALPLWIQNPPKISWDNRLKTAWLYAPLLILVFLVIGMGQFLASKGESPENTPSGAMGEGTTFDGDTKIESLPISDLIMPPAIINITPIEFTDLIAPQRPLFDKSKVDLAVINIFASWCAPCTTEMPILQGFSDRDIPVYGIVFRDTPDSVTNFLARWGQPFDRLSLDDTGQHVGALGVTAVPETFVIDRTSGSILYRHRGAIVPTDVQKVFDPIFEQYTPKTATKGDKTP